MFLRTFKNPAHIHPKRLDEVKARAAFTPVVRSIDNEAYPDGISIDRLRYCTPLEAKKIALSHLSKPGSKQSFGGFLMLKQADIKLINLITIDILTEKKIKSQSEFLQNYVSTVPELIQVLEGFNIFPLQKCNYCGVLATPMNGSDRVPPSSKVTKDSEGNVAHAEIFYLWKHIVANEPGNLFFQELARHLTQKSTHYFDSNPTDVTHNPIP